MNHFMYTHYSPRPLADTEAYRRLMNHSKHLLMQIKMSVIFFIGGVIIVICIVYIIFQCRVKVGKPLSRQVHNRRTPKEDTKELFSSTDTLENLLPSNKNSIPLKIRKETEFYV